MRILITNDDGMDAPGLAVLKDIAVELSGPEGRVLTVAPVHEQSGNSHAVSFVSPMMVQRSREDVIGVIGTPADCVLVGLHEFGPDDPPDLVLSGVNRGNNSGENAVYSGTVGAALEASLHGVKAVALSQYYGHLNRKLADPFEAAVEYGATVVRTLLKEAPWRQLPYPAFYNVNFPPCAATDVAGARAAPQGARIGGRFQVIPQPSPNGREFMWVSTDRQDRRAEPGSDVEVNLENYISITPMRADMTDHDSLAMIAPLFQ